MATNNVDIDYNTLSNFLVTSETLLAETIGKRGASKYNEKILSVTQSSGGQTSFCCEPLRERTIHQSGVAGATIARTTFLTIDTALVYVDLLLSKGWAV